MRLGNTAPEEILQWWRAVDNTVFDLTGPVDLKLEPPAPETNASPLDRLTVGIVFGIFINSHKLFTHVIKFKPEFHSRQAQTRLLLYSIPGVNLFFLANCGLFKSLFEFHVNFPVLSIATTEDFFRLVSTEWILHLQLKQYTQYRFGIGPNQKNMKFALPASFA